MDRFKFKVNLVYIASSSQGSTEKLCLKKEKKRKRRTLNWKVAGYDLG